MLISPQSGQTGAPFFWGVRRGATISITSTHWMGRKTNKQSISITSIMRWNNLWAIKALLSSGIPFISVQPFEGGTHFFRLYIFYLFYRDVNHFNWRHLNESHSEWVSDWCPLILWQSFESVSNYFSCCKLVSIYGEHRKWKWPAQALSTDCDKEIMAKTSHKKTKAKKQCKLTIN